MLHRCSAEGTARRSALLDGESSSKTRMAFRVSTILQSDLKAGRHYRFRYPCSTCSTAMASTDAGATCRRFSRQLANPISASTLKRTAHNVRACAQFGLEGIVVSKRKDVPYRPGRGEHWLKSKCVQHQEFVIVGYVPSMAASASVGSVLRRARHGHCAPILNGLHLASQPSVRPYRHELIGGSLGRAGSYEIEYRGWTHDGLVCAPPFKRSGRASLRTKSCSRRLAKTRGGS